ncbi:unnamed protein product [Rotaria sp. Silwood2]|nr:unnamed protein product [Rotaria sp. Silwood2]CAF4639586.1 unnamed protein product [Rotaria sp. Silwood2]
MSNNSQYEKDSRGRINTNSTTRRQAFNTAKEVNDIPRCQSPNRQFKVQDKYTGKELRAWEYTNNRGQMIDFREDKPKTYPDGGKQSGHINAGEAGSKLNKQHHNYETK